MMGEGHLLPISSTICASSVATWCFFLFLAHRDVCIGVYIGLAVWHSSYDEAELGWGDITTFHGLTLVSSALYGDSLASLFVRDNLLDILFCWIRQR
ncbi:hypothetical protein V8F06_009370 [Rhypophila decipiens]